MPTEPSASFFLAGSFFPSVVSMKYSMPTVLLLLGPSFRWHERTNVAPALISPLMSTVMSSRSTPEIMAFVLLVTVPPEIVYAIFEPKRSMVPDSAVAVMFMANTANINSSFFIIFLFYC